MHNPVRVTVGKIHPVDAFPAPACTPALLSRGTPASAACESGCAGERGAAVASVHQRLQFVGSESGKLLALRQVRRSAGLLSVAAWATRCWALLLMLQHACALLHRRWLVACGHLSWYSYPAGSERWRSTGALLVLGRRLCYLPRLVPSAQDACCAQGPGPARAPSRQHHG